MTIKHYLLLSACLLSACIDEFPLDGDIPAPQPVIEGLVANAEGESFVRISSELSILGMQEDPAPLVSGAQVAVVDDNGIITPFCEKSEGIYLPEDDSFVGNILSEYTLQVQLADGRSYLSEAEVLHPGVDVDTIFVVFEQNNIPNTSQLTGKHNFFITVSTNASEQPVLFRTNSFGIAQVAAYIDPPPPQCIDPPCPEICYSFRGPINRELVLGSTEGTVENQLTLQATTEKYDFHGHYFVRIKTFSLSSKGFEFWNSIASQQEIDGSIFDPQLTEIAEGNITDLSSNEPIIGYFGASAVSSDSLFFNRFESAGFLAPIPTARNSCVDVWRAATLEIPPQFQ